MKHITIIVMSLILWIGLTQTIKANHIIVTTGDTIDVFTDINIGDIWNADTIRVCGNGIIVLQAGPIDNYTYQWDLISNIYYTYRISYDPNIEGTFQLVGCIIMGTGLSTLFYIEYLTPQTSSQTITICQGDSLTIGTHTYTTTGTYIDTLAAVNTCDSIVTTNLTVMAYPILTVSPIDTIICAGSIITLHASGTGTSFNWSTSETTQDISVMTDTNVSIWVSTSNACGTITDTINITVYHVFSSTNVVEINNAQTYIINGHTYTTTGIYYDTLFTVHGCDSVVITNLTVLTDILTTSQTGEVPVIYPNPVNDILTINIARISTGSTTATPKVEIINLQGQVVKSIKLTNAKNTIDVKELIGGIYTLRMITDKGIFVRKLVKE